MRNSIMLVASDKIESTRTGTATTKDPCGMPSDTESIIVVFFVVELAALL